MHSISSAEDTTTLSLTSSFAISSYIFGPRSCAAGSIVNFYAAAVGQYLVFSSWISWLATATSLSVSVVLIKHILGVGLFYHATVVIDLFLSLHLRDFIVPAIYVI